MATSIWKGHLTFGLVSIPVKLCRAARAEKVAFRQVHEATGTRVRQALYREPEDSLDMQGLFGRGTRHGRRYVVAEKQKRASLRYGDPVSFAAESGGGQP